MDSGIAELESKVRAWLERYEDLVDGAEIDRVKADILAGRDEMVPFRVEDYERSEAEGFTRSAAVSAGRL